MPSDPAQVRPAEEDGRALAEQGHARHARTLERLSGELDEVLARLIAADQRHRREP